MPALPRYGRFDQSLTLLAKGYRFIGEACDQLHSDIFQTRLLLAPAICMRGVQAARLFYDPGRFVRQGAMPGLVRKTLIGEGGVQGLDGAAHQARKAMFMALMSEARIRELAEGTRTHWRAAVPGWSRRDAIVLMDEAELLLCCAVCDWAGVPLAHADARHRARQLGTMIDGAGGLGARHWRARNARRQAEAWIGGLVREVRRGALQPAQQSALHLIATHRDPQGGLLPEHTAAVEILNVLRPTVAIGRYIVFAALALHEHPAAAERAAADPLYADWFVQEVRRYYPFFPAAAARVRSDFEWRGYRFAKGQRVLLDLYGTNRGPHWGDPDVFRPDRFAQYQPDAYDFIPQGGGEHQTHHRCAGEWITIVLMRECVDALLHDMTYVVPAQDLTVDLGRMPAQPRSRFLMASIVPGRGVRPASAG